MRYPTGFFHLRAFQFNWRSRQVFEQSDTCAEQDGHQVDMDFVKQSRFYALLRDTCGGYGDVLVACDRFCLFNGAFNAVGDEREQRSFLDDAVSRVWTRFSTGRCIRR